MNETDGGPAQTGAEEGLTQTGVDAQGPADGTAPAEGAEQPACGTTCGAEHSDGCCPSGCTSVSDIDCAPRCGNGLLERGEQCDPLSGCPATCPNRGCTQYRLEGSVAECTAICVESGQEPACRPDDGCCPSGCTSNSDNDCSTVCGNGVKEGQETCDPLSTCPTSCPAMGCQLRKLANAGTCTAQCVNDRQQTVCAPGDGCCPAACNNNNDLDCAPACGNGVIERGETCEPVADCTRRQTACVSDQNTIRAGRGNAAACTFACQASARPCGPTDGACPSGCGADADCLPRPTDCVSIEWCVKPFQPNQGQVICKTDDDPRCTPAERTAECARDARSVCGANHVRPIQYSPPIAGNSSG